MMRACGQNWRALKYAHHTLKADKEVALLAVKQSWLALYLVDKQLRSDPSIMLASQHALCIKVAQHMDWRCVLHPAPLVLVWCFAAGGKPRLESSILHCSTVEEV